MQRINSECAVTGHIAVERLRADPVLHVEKVQGVLTLEPCQKQILYAVRDYDRVCIAAAHDLGKTFVMAKVVLWAGSVFPGCKIVTTAPTWNQVEKLLWSEIRTGFAKSIVPLGGTMLQTEWKVADDWFAFGISPQENAGQGDGQGRDSRMQGIHGNLVIVIFDEATGINKTRWIQAEGLLTSANVKFIAIGNPTSRNSEFYRCFSDDQFHKIYLSCFDSPNLKANKINSVSDIERELARLLMLESEQRLKRLRSYKIVVPQLLTTQWVMGRALKWGLTHPLFVTKVLGQFPDDSDNALFPLSLIELAQTRDAEPDPGLRSIGVDPARFGADSTVITVLEGPDQTLRKELVKHATTQVTGYLVQLISGLPRKQKEVVCIDGTGLGAGVVDELKEARQQGLIPGATEIRECHFGASCKSDDDKKHYANLKAKIFVELSESMKNDLSLLKDGVYLEELPAIIYKFDSKGRYVIESKDDYKKRTGLGSPDSADSLALADYGRRPVKRVGSFSDKLMGGTSMRDYTGTIAGAMGGADQW